VGQEKWYQQSSRLISTSDC